MSENIKGIKDCEEKNLQKENDFCENSSNFNWDAFRYKDTIPQNISLLQTTFILVSMRKDGSNISRTPMVE
jgi:hypothetical protein